MEKVNLARELFVDIGEQFFNSVQWDADALVDFIASCLEFIHFFRAWAQGPDDGSQFVAQFRCVLDGASQRTGHSDIVLSLLGEGVHSLVQCFDGGGVFG